MDARTFRRAARRSAVAHAKTNSAIAAMRQGCDEWRLACMQWLRPKVLAIEFQQVEGIEQDPIVVPPAMQIVEDRDAVCVATDRLAVDGGRTGPDRRHRLGDERIPRGPIVTVAREQRTGPSVFRAISL